MANRIHNGLYEGIHVSQLLRTEARTNRKMHSQGFLVTVTCTHFRSHPHALQYMRNMLATDTFQTMMDWRILASPKHYCGTIQQHVPASESHCSQCLSNWVTTAQHFQPSANSLLIINRRDSSCVAKKKYGYMLTPS